MSVQSRASDLYARLLVVAEENRDRVNFAIRAHFSYDESGKEAKRVIPFLTRMAAANGSEKLLTHLLAFEDLNAQEDPQCILAYFDAVLTGCADNNTFTRGTAEQQKWSLRHLCEYFPDFDMDTVNEKTGKTLLETAASYRDNLTAIQTLINRGVTYADDAAAIHALRSKCYKNTAYLIGMQKRKRTTVDEEARPAKVQKRTFKFIFG